MGGGLFQLIQYGLQDYWLMGEKMPNYYNSYTLPTTLVEAENIIPTECATTKNNLFKKELEEPDNLINLQQKLICNII